MCLTSHRRGSPCATSWILAEEVVDLAAHVLLGATPIPGRNYPLRIVLNGKPLSRGTLQINLCKKWLKVKAFLAKQFPSLSLAFDHADHLADFNAFSSQSACGI